MFKNLNKTKGIWGEIKEAFLKLVMFFFFFPEMWGDAEISINRWLLVICRIIKTFQCRESLSFRTTSLWGHTQQIPSIYVFNDNRKNKRGLWRMVAGGNIWLSPSVCQSQQHEKKNLCNKTQTPGCSLIYFPSFISISGILWMENVRG